MIKKLLVAITLVAVVVACGDKKKSTTEEAPKCVCVASLAENADSLMNLAEVTVVGKLATCPLSNGFVLKGEGAFAQIILAEGVEVNEELVGGPVSVTGKLSAITLDSAAIAEIEAKMAEAKANCEAAKEETCEKKCEKAEGTEEKGCCSKEEGKKCCAAPKVGDNVFTLTVTKIEKFECANAEKKCCKAEGETKECEKKCEGETKECEKKCEGETKTEE
jgi:hypothetical protein